MNTRLACAAVTFLVAGMPAWAQMRPPPGRPGGGQPTNRPGMMNPGMNMGAGMGNPGMSMMGPNIRQSMPMMPSGQGAMPSGRTAAAGGYPMNQGGQYGSNGQKGYDQGNQPSTAIQPAGNKSQEIRSEQDSDLDAKTRDRINAFLLQMDDDKDGRISNKEARGMIRELFTDLDRDRDGYLDRNELRLGLARFAGLRGPHAGVGNVPASALTTGSGTGSARAASGTSSGGSSKSGY
jgi:hypothetical protein